MIYRRFLNIALACALYAAGTAQGNDETVLAAYDAYRAADAERLARHVRALAGHPLEPWAEYWRLRLGIEELGQAEAERYLEQHAGTYLAEQMRADWLRELGRREDWSAFERALGPLVGDDPEIRCQAWRARLARGDAQAALEARAVWLEPRELPEGCELLADELVARDAREAEGAWLRARALVYYGYTSAARRTLERLDAGARPDERLLARALRAPAAFLRQAAGALDSRPMREIVVFAVLRLARADLPVAAAAMDAGAPKSLPAADRDYLWARLATLAAFEHRDEALAWYARADGAALDDTQLAWKARAALRAGQWRTVLEAIEPMSPAARTDLAWTYWRGRALEALGDAERAREEYQRIAGQPLYYSVLATEALGGKAQIPLPHHVPTEAEVDTARGDVELERSLALFRVGLRAEATREWMFAVRRLDDQQLLAAAELARREGFYDRAIGTAGRTESLHDYRLRYLAPFRDVFRQHADAHGMEEAWILGTVRQESRFIVDARSSAGATGLMQLLPQTARWMARRSGYPRFSVARVTEVSTNVDLGSRYLRHMLERLGHPVLASAAYNAGPNRARRWQPARSLEGAIFVESIPLDETREYVKRVMANTVHYALLLEGSSPSLTERLGVVFGRDAPLAEADSD